MANYTQQNLLVPIIIALGKSGKPMTTDELYPVLTSMLLPWGVDLESYEGRKDTIFSQTIRNFTAPQRITELNSTFVKNEDGKLLLTEFGQKVYYAILNTGTGSSKKKINATYPVQIIFYGAPGTGKSNEIKRMTGDGTFGKDNTFRTTFHPDSDYSSFVGAYKPIWNGEKIIYDFRPQTFLKAYIAAWTNPDNNIALVIEEINRGNCAQIFGDIFQLLDRESNGLSKYPIEADIDMQSYLSGELGQIDKIYDGSQIAAMNDYYGAHYDRAFEAIKNGKILVLPMNLSILATMNTSDQSLFPMDSAFKRRWEWEYIPIKDAHKEWKIQLDKSHELIDWWQFLKRINAVISDLTTSEDKQLGYFFCQPNDFVNSNHEADEKEDLITAKYFVDKVIFYLWNDVFKDYAFDAKCCKNSDDKEVLFAEFYNEDGKTVNVDVLKHFFETLKDDTQESLVKTKSANTGSAVGNGETFEETETQDTTTAEE